MKSNKELLNQALEIIEAGSYTVNGSTVTLKLTPAQRMESRVLFPDDVHAIEPAPAAEPVRVTCENADSFVRARALAAEGHKVMVLNFANAFNPGGGVRWGASAQEEELCRCSTLLPTLESEICAPYYRHHKDIGSDLATDAMILSPNVEIFFSRDEGLLSETTCVSVMTCAAPNLYGNESVTAAQFVSLMESRVRSVLRAAAASGCTAFVAGAFGCGAFGNPPVIVSEIFERAIREIPMGSLRVIDFAVLSRRGVNYDVFSEMASHFAE